MHAEYLFDHFVCVLEADYPFCTDGETFVVTLVFCKHYNFVTVTPLAWFMFVDWIQNDLQAKAHHSFVINIGLHIRTPWSPK